MTDSISNLVKNMERKRFDDLARFDRMDFMLASMKQTLDSIHSKFDLLFGPMYPNFPMVASTPNFTSEPSLVSVVTHLAPTINFHHVNDISKEQEETIVVEGETEATFQYDTNNDKKDDLDDIGQEPSQAVDDKAIDTYLVGEVREPSPIFLHISCSSASSDTMIQLQKEHLPSCVNFINIFPSMTSIDSNFYIHNSDLAATMSMMQASLTSTIFATASTCLINCCKPFYASIVCFPSLAQFYNYVFDPGITTMGFGSLLTYPMVELFLMWPCVFHHVCDAHVQILVVKIPGLEGCMAFTLIKVAAGTLMIYGPDLHTFFTLPSSFIVVNSVPCSCAQSGMGTITIGLAVGLVIRLVYYLTSCNANNKFYWLVLSVPQVKAIIHRKQYGYNDNVFVLIVQYFYIPVSEVIKWVTTLFWTQFEVQEMTKYYEPIVKELISLLYFAFLKLKHQWVAPFRGFFPCFLVCTLSYGPINNSWIQHLPLVSVKKVMISSTCWTILLKCCYDEISASLLSIAQFKFESFCLGGWCNFISNHSRIASKSSLDCEPLCLCAAFIHPTVAHSSFGTSNLPPKCMPNMVIHELHNYLFSSLSNSSTSNVAYGITADPRVKMTTMDLFCGGATLFIQGRKPWFSFLLVA